MLNKTLFGILTLLLAGLISACQPAATGEPALENEPVDTREVTLMLDWVPNTNHTGLLNSINDFLPG